MNTISFYDTNARLEVTRTKVIQLQGCKALIIEVAVCCIFVPSCPPRRLEVYCLPSY